MLLFKVVEQDSVVRKIWRLTFHFLYFLRVWL